MRILIIEDEHKIAKSIKKGLEQERYVADVAYDGISGFDLASSEVFDLLIVDVMLPGLDGISLCRKLRALGNHVPIIILTAKSQINDKVDGLDSGADDYLTKPFSFEELLARIRALVRRPREALNEKLKSGLLEMDTLSFEVYLSGETVSLTGKEYSLLEFMMRNPGRVITKEEIISHVWSYDSDILPNTVEATIKNIRHKFEKILKGSGLLIKTVRGFGYKLDSTLG